jgi:predicted nucleic acid-binding protein
MHAGRRKDTLTSALDGLLELFDARVLSFDTDAARCYAQLTTKAKTAGKGFPMPDGYIAAIAFANGFTVATRDIGPFDAVGVPVINPWRHQKQE